VTHLARTLTTAVIATLEDAGITVGDGEQPAGSGWQAGPDNSAFVGYAVVHPVGGGDSYGPIDGPDQDFEPVYQISAYGATRAQAELIGDLARTAMVNTPIIVTDRRVVLVSIELLGGCRRDDQVLPPVWQAVDRFRVLTVPT